MDRRDATIAHLRTEISALESRLDSSNQLVVALRQQLDAHETRSTDDRRTQVYRRAAIDIAPGNQDREFGEESSPDLSEIGSVLEALAARLDHKFAEIRALSEITAKVNAGVFFDEVLDHLFESFDSLIPYDRIGVALIEASETGTALVRSQWMRAKYHSTALRNGYVAPLAGTSLADIADSRRPRIINDLKAHVAGREASTSTQLILEEGIRASLTCPLLVNDEATGFIFFSSREPDTYRDQHVELFMQIAGELALTLEKSRAYEDLYLRNEFIRSVFGRYVTNEVAEAALRGADGLALGGERRLVTVLMSDLRGFTPMSEELPPEEVVDALNVHLGMMVETIMQYGGSIDNFIGDAIMAVFGLPVAKADDAARAVACAIAMQNAMRRVNAELMDRGTPPLQMGIGLSTGEAVAGNIGSDARLKYSVIGPTVNLAARIESMTSGGQILGCARTHAAVSARLRTDGALSVKLKGVSEPVRVHDIVGIGAPFEITKAL